MESDQLDEVRVAREALEREHGGGVTDSLLIVVLCVLMFLVFLF